MITVSSCSKTYAVILYGHSFSFVCRYCLLAISLVDFFHVYMFKMNVKRNLTVVPCCRGFCSTEGYLNNLQVSQCYFNLEFMFVQCLLPGGKCFSPGSFFQPVLPACTSACKTQVKQQPQRSALRCLQCLILRQSAGPALADLASGNQGHVSFRSL